MKQAEKQVNNFLSKNNISVTQNQFDALVSFTFNLGDVWTSTSTFQLKTYLINGVSNYNSSQITTAFTNWNKDGNMKPLEGLTKRRKAEAELFLSGASVVCDCSASYAGTYTTYDVQTSLNIRSESSHSTSGSVVGSIPSGAKFTVTKSNGSIAHVNYNGTTGIVSMSYIQRVDNPWHSELKPVDIGDEWYGYIINSKEWKHLTNDGENVSFRTQTGEKKQLWKFTKNSDGSYKIISLADGKVLDVTGESSENDANVGVYTDKNNNAQKWYIYGSSGQNYLKAACTDCVLDLDGGKFYEGVNAQMWKYDSSDDAEKLHLWELKKSAELSVDIGNSAGKTTFTWDSLEIADHYDVKIWNGTYWDGDYAYSDWHNKETSSSFTLPEGYYEAYVDTVTPDGSVYMSNVVKFDVKAATFNVTFNANGGSASTTNKTVTHNSTYGSLPTPTRTGYTFNGWYTAASEGSKVDANTKVTITANQTLYAHWTANSYTIAYNSNGGSGSTGNSTMTYDKAANLNANGFSKTGYTFKGWNTKADGSGTAYADKASVKNLATSGTVTLYAQWTAKSVSVKFFRNHDGNDTESTTETFTYDVSNQKFGYKTDGTGRHSPMNPANVGFGAWSRTGYEMLGWSADRNATSIQHSTYSGVGNDWINSKSPSINLYAIWRAKQYTVTFDTTNSGSVSQPSKTVTYNSTYGDLPTPTRTGYTFSGWFTEKTGGTKVTVDTKVTITANQTLYAQWTENRPNLPEAIPTIQDYFENGNNVKITWNACENATGYDVRIYKDNEKDAFKALWNVQGTSCVLNLEPGKYRVNVCSVNSKYAFWTVGREISFNAKLNLPEAIPTIQDYFENGNNVKITWNACENATGYDVRIYKENEKEAFKAIWNVQGTSCILNLEPGKYRVNVCSVNSKYKCWTVGREISFTAKISIIKGDANNDKAVDVADAVMLQKWLLGEGNLTNWKNVDLCEDGRIDVFDMIEMRKLIANK